MSATDETPRADLGLRVIVGWKLVKSAAELLAGALFLMLPSVREQGGIRDLAVVLSKHAAEAWSHALASVLLQATTPRHLEVIATALVLDGLLSALEGWTLHRRHWWGRWLVILATAAMLPFEVVALVRRLTVWRIVTLLANAAIVLYLVRRRITASTSRLERRRPTSWNR